MKTTTQRDIVRSWNKIFRGKQAGSKYHDRSPILAMEDRFIYRAYQAVFPYTGNDDILVNTYTFTEAVTKENKQVHTYSALLRASTNDLANKSNKWINNNELHTFIFFISTVPSPKRGQLKGLYEMEERHGEGREITTNERKQIQAWTKTCYFYSIRRIQEMEKEREKEDQIVTENI